MNMTKLMRFVIAPRCWKITEKSHLTLRAKRATFTFTKPEAGGQTVFPDRSDLIGQKLVKNSKN